MEFILRILSVLEVENWEDLPGKTIRVETDGEFGSIRGIGHIIKDVWFYPERDLYYMIKD